MGVLNAIEIGDQEAHEKLTGRFFFQLYPNSGYEDVGNVVSYTHGQSRELRTRVVAEKGFRRVNDEQLDIVHDMLELTLDERNDFLERMITLASSQTNADQDADTGYTETISSVELDRWYFLTKRPASYYVVSVSAVTMTEDTDYEIDADAGRIKFLSTGSISADDDVDLNYNVPERGYRSYTALNKPLFNGAGRFEETNQQSAEPLRLTTGNCNVQITSFPEQSGEFANITLRLTWTNKPTITKRNAYNALGSDAS